MPMPRKPRRHCLACQKETPGPHHKYCNNRCQHDYQLKIYLEKWFRGEVPGFKSKGLVTGQIKKFLRQKYQNKCCLCGWAEVNPYTGVVPLTAHHIDGNWRNTTEDNLQLLCPNCHALTPNYCGLNKGQGRRRDQSKTARFIEAQEIVEGYKD